MLFGYHPDPAIAETASQSVAENLLIQQVDPRVSCEVQARMHLRIDARRRRWRRSEDRFQRLSFCVPCGVLKSLCRPSPCDSLAVRCNRNHYTHSAAGCQTVCSTACRGEVISAQVSNLTPCLYRSAFWTGRVAVQFPPAHLPPSRSISSTPSEDESRMIVAVYTKPKAP